MCLGSPAPALWYSLPEGERAIRARLTSDQCVVDDQHYFVLGRLVIPVHDSSDPFVWLTWVSLSEQRTGTHGPPALGRTTLGHIADARPRVGRGSSTWLA